LIRGGFYSTRTAKTGLEIMLFGSPASILPNDKQPCQEVENEIKTKSFPQV